MSFSRQRSSAHTVRRQTPRAIARIVNLFETDCRCTYIMVYQNLMAFASLLAVPCVWVGGCDTRREDSSSLWRVKNSPALHANCLVQFSHREEIRVELSVNGR